MKTLAIESGDLVIDNGDFKVIEGSEELEQNTFIGLSTFKGEWFLDPDLGLDPDKMWGKVTDAQMRATVIAELGKQSRIDTIENVEINRDERARTAHLHFRVQSDDGDIVESGVNDIAR